MIDLHSHILPGLDDGTQTMEDAVSLARLAVAEGIRVMAGTPHVRDDFPTAPEAMESRLAEVQEALRREDVPLDVRGGGEIAIDRLEVLGPDELRRFGLAGNPSYVLLEFPYFGWPLVLESQVIDLLGRGITAVIAHPERNAEVQHEPRRLRSIVDAGALVQVTAASIDGRLGKRVRATGLQLIEDGVAHLLASDAHRPDVRRGGLRAARAALSDEGLARWLTENVPEAIAFGTPVPARPLSTRRRRRLRLFR